MNADTNSQRFYQGTRDDLKPGDVFYHGTRADLKVGDLIGPSYTSNYGSRRKANHVYFSATLEAAVWGAELAQGEGRGRIYLVEPTGPFVDDPNLTEWQGHSPERLKEMKDHLARLKEQGIEAVDD